MKSLASFVNRITATLPYPTPHYLTIFIAIPQCQCQCTSLQCSVMQSSLVQSNPNGAKHAASANHVQFNVVYQVAIRLHSTQGPPLWAERLCAVTECCTPGWGRIRLAWGRRLTPTHPPTHSQWSSRLSSPTCRVHVQPWRSLNQTLVNFHWQ